MVRGPAAREGLRLLYQVELDAPIPASIVLLVVGHQRACWSHALARKAVCTDPVLDEPVPDGLGAFLAKNLVVELAPALNGFADSPSYHTS